MGAAQRISLGLVLAALATLPFWIARVGLYQYLGIEILVWGLYALSYNLLLGYTGLPSFGHGAYFGVGAYAFGLMQKYVGANLWLDLAGAILAAALSGALVATFISHRRGIYYALMTIAFCQIFWFVAIKWHSVTGGEDGLLGLKRMPAELGFASISLADNVALYYFVLVVCVAVTALLWRIVHSPFGRVIQAIRQNETRVAFVGYHVWLYKWLVFVLSAGTGATGRVSRRHEPAFVWLCGDDDAHRRRAGQLLGTLDRCCDLFHRARCARRAHVDLVAVVWPDVHGHRRAQARGHRRHVAGVAIAAQCAS